MLRIKKKSKWKLEGNDSASIGVSFGVSVQAGKGSFSLRHGGGALTTFRYANFGAGAGFGVKLPVSGNIAPGAFPSIGEIYLLESFKGDELSPKDLIGPCFFVEVSLMLGGGVSGIALLLGIPPDQESIYREFAVMVLELGAAAGGGAMAVKGISMVPGLENHAKAVLYMGGMNVGVAYEAAVTGGGGVVWIGDIESIPIKVDIQSVEVTTLRSASGARYLKLVLPSDVLFDFDKDTIGTRRNRAAAAYTLMQVVMIIRKQPLYKVGIRGYTDYIGTTIYNQGLSQRRANRVRDWLVQNGVSAGAFRFVNGEGMADPVADNRTPLGRAKNRRVEILLMD